MKVLAWYIDLSIDTIAVNNNSYTCQKVYNPHDIKFIRYHVTKSRSTLIYANLAFV